MANGKIHKLGTLYVKGNKIPRPTRPWENGEDPDGAPGTGNITSYPGGSIEIRDTDSDDAYKIQWVEVNYNGDKLLVCDRNILSNISWNELDNLDLIYGKNIYIDGQKCKIRVLTGGMDVRDDGDYYSGGYPENNEWDRIITNEGNFSGLPKPSSSDLNDILSSSDFNSSHNAVWNWAGMYSWAQELFKPMKGRRSMRGYESARILDAFLAEKHQPFTGWRPVLEVTNFAPTISDSDKDLGEFTSSFTKNYTIDDADGDKLNVTEKVNNETIRFMTTQNPGSTITFSIKDKWSELSTGKHTITIEVDDRNGGIATRKWTFTKKSTVPIISGTDKDFGTMLSPLKQQYTVSNDNNEKMTVTEKLNGETLRTLNNQSSGTSLTLDLTEKWKSLSLSKHTITIEAKNSVGEIAVRKWTFTKGNNAPSIDGFDADLGESDLPINTDYSVTDKDGDKLRIIEKINDNIIRTLEQQESGKFKFDTNKEWPNLQAGKHTATIEVDDYNGGKAKRTYTFTKITPNITEPIIISPEDNSRQESVFYIEFKLGKSNNGKPQYPRVEASKNSNFGPDIKVFKEIEINKEGNWINHTEEVSNEDTNYNLRIKLKIEDKSLKYFRVSSSDKTITVDSKVITLKFNNRLEFETLPQKIDFTPYSISLIDKKEIDSKATMEVYACNNALDKNKQWENITEEYKLDKPYVFTNKNKENENWAISVKYKIEANDATGEISIDAIGIGVV